MNINQEKTRLDEILSQSNKPNPEEKKPRKSEQKQQSNILDERTDFKLVGYQDGLFMSVDYQEGFAHGLAQGISEARRRVLSSLGKSLKENREYKLNSSFDTVEINALLGVEPLSFFALPSSQPE